VGLRGSIRKKRDGEELSTSEIQEFVAGVADDSIPDYLTGPALIAWLAGWREAEEAA